MLKSLTVNKEWRTGKRRKRKGGRRGVKADGRKKTETTETSKSIIKAEKGTKPRNKKLIRE